ncbi:14983_t:CDS:2, partial [Dentiscutata erythropus]
MDIKQPMQQQYYSPLHPRSPHPSPVPYLLNLNTVSPNVSPNISPTIDSNIYPAINSKINPTMNSEINPYNSTIIQVTASSAEVDEKNICCICRREQRKIKESWACIVLLTIVIIIVILIAVALAILGESRKNS